MHKNQQDSEDGLNHEIHKENCWWYYHFSNGKNFIPLGERNSPRDAISYAKKFYSNIYSRIDGCKVCCKTEDTDYYNNTKTKGNFKQIR